MKQNKTKTKTPFWFQLVEKKYFQRREFLFFSLQVVCIYNICTFQLQHLILLLLPLWEREAQHPSWFYHATVISWRRKRQKEEATTFSCQTLFLLLGRAAAFSVSLPVLLLCKGGAFTTHEEQRWERQLLRVHEECIISSWFLTSRVQHFAKGWSAALSFYQRTWSSWSTEPRVNVSIGPVVMGHHRWHSFAWQEEKSSSKGPGVAASAWAQPQHPPTLPHPVSHCKGWIDQHPSRLDTVPPQQGSCFWTAHKPAPHL